MFLPFLYSLHKIKYNLLKRDNVLLNVFLHILERIVDVYFALLPRRKPSQERLNSAHLIAHRGAHNHAQNIWENTLEAFQLAEDIGCWGIELDVHVTADNILVVNHDPTLKRLWGYDIAIINLSFTDLRALVPEVPTLAEVIAKFGRTMHLFIELKAPLSDAQTLVNVLQSLSPGEDYHLLSLDETIFYPLSQFPRSCLLLVALPNNNRQLCALSLKEPYGGVLGHYLLLTLPTIAQLRQANQNVGVGFIDSKYSLYRELNRGLIWIFTDQPAKINSFLRS